MRGLMAGQNTGITAAVVRDGSAVILSYNVGIEVDQTFA
jgi:hypothetical protein